MPKSQHPVEERRDGERRFREPWHLDKRVPITLIFTIILQTISMAWWASGIDHTVADHEKRLAAAEIRQDAEGVARQPITDRLARLEEKSTYTIETLNHIQNLLETRTAIPAPPPTK